MICACYFCSRISFSLEMWYITKEESTSMQLDEENARKMLRTTVAYW